MGEDRNADPLAIMSSLYIHIPFCEHKCIYCDFYSIAPNGTGRQAYDALFERFLNSLTKEISLRGSDERFRVPFETVFLGGGTPSLLSPGHVSDLMELLGRHFMLSSEAEVTLETNPGTVDRAKLSGFREAGVNRLSIGIQSFHQDDLDFLTRIHSADQAKACVSDAFHAGFANVSLDLIFSLPGQTPERWRSNLEQAIGLGPTHLSCYSLIVEPNTPLSRMVRSGQARTLSPDADAELYEMTIDVLSKAGYEQYEISNFAKPGFQSRHNSNYWNHSNYLGFGPSAHSFWNATRWWNVANTAGYSDALDRGVLPVAGEETLSERQLWEEFVFLGLRSSGVSTRNATVRFQRDFAGEYSGMIDQLVLRELARYDGQTLRLTPKGYALCDEISHRFLT